MILQFFVKSDNRIPYKVFVKCVYKILLEVLA